MPPLKLHTLPLFVTMSVFAFSQADLFRNDVLWIQIHCYYKWHNCYRLATECFASSNHLAMGNSSSVGLVHVLPNYFFWLLKLYLYPGTTTIWWYGTYFIAVHTTYCTASSAVASCWRLASFVVGVIHRMAVTVCYQTSTPVNWYVSLVNASSAVEALQ